MMQKKPELNFFQIWNMCFGFLGIQFGFALQNSSVSRIFQTLGAPVDQIPLLWLAAPLTGLLVQPIVGYYSDRTWNRLGRRRPYFLYGAILTSFALVFMPNSPTLWIAAGMLWVLDASLNITMEPFRALVGDMLPKKQRAFGYAMQSFFIGVGAVVASALPWMLTNWAGVSNTATEGVLPKSVIWSFYVGAAVLFCAVLWTIVRTKEYSPQQLNEFEGRTEQESSGFILTTLYKDIVNMPRTMRQLAVVQFFSWFALFAMWIYSTAGVTAYHYGSSDTSSKAYNDGADWVGVLFAAYNGFAALAAIIIPRLVKMTSMQTAHLINLLCGSAGLLSFIFISDPRWLMLSMVGVGIAWASILSLPYAMLANALPSHKMGTYMGIFNMFIVLPQILAATVIGFLVKYAFDGQAIYALAVGAGCFVLGGLSALRVSTD
jgi:maltose/moltooligosaccharide transporter